MPAPQNRPPILTRLRQVREQRGLTQGELAERAGTGGKGQMSRWEAGQGIYLDSALRLARALDVHVEDLFELDPQVRPEDAAVERQREALADGEPRPLVAST